MKALILLLIATIVSSIFIPIVPGQKRCMSTFSGFEPLKLEAVFPNIPEKVQGQGFKISIISTENATDISEHVVDAGSTFRKEIKLVSNIIYEICFEIVTDRYYFPNYQELSIGYRITEDLVKLVGTIDIPKEIANSKKLTDIYVYAEEITRINNKVIEYQDKERKLEDDISNDNVHKNFRIISLTLIECAVIVLSGIYQIFALRRFLIDKSLY